MSSGIGSFSGVGLLERIGGNRHNEALAHAHLAHLARLARLAGDGPEADAQAATARRLASASADPAYVTQIELALTVERWSELSTG